MTSRVNKSKPCKQQAHVTVRDNISYEEYTIGKKHRSQAEG